MPFPVALALMAGGMGMDVIMDQVARSRALQESHKTRDILGLIAMSQFGTGRSALEKGRGRAKEETQARFRQAGGYAPEVVAKSLADIDKDFAMSMDQLRTGLMTQALSGGLGARMQVPQPPMPSFTGLGAGIGSLMATGGGVGDPFQPPELESTIEAMQPPAGLNMPPMFTPETSFRGAGMQALTPLYGGQ